MMKEILKAENITKKYGKQNVVNGISFAVNENTFNAILGPSGSGKSTLLNILSGMMKPSSGEIRYGNKVISEYSQTQLADWKRFEVGNVFQSYMLLNNLTAEENIKIGIAPGKTPLSFDRLTSMLEIDSILDKFPSQLSGGQQQRVAIARAVIKAPRLLFCDEATGALDEENSKKVVGLLHGLKAAFGVTILFTTHNVQIAETADRIITIKNGLLYKDVVNDNPIPAEDMIWG
jgi:ABC-type antimicrobial peptide transport system, ATPase component